MIKRAFDTVRGFHGDEEGSALETVLMIAVAALIGIGVQKLGGQLLAVAEKTAKGTMENSSVGY